MADASVLDPFANLQRLTAFNKVLSTKAAIAQTPKQLVWALNKAKLYRYVPMVPEKQRHTLFPN